LLGPRLSADPREWVARHGQVHHQESEVFAVSERVQVGVGLHVGENAEAGGDHPFGPGDSIVLLGRRANLDQFREKFVV